MDADFWRVLTRHLGYNGGLLVLLAFVIIGTASLVRGLSEGNPLYLAIAAACGLGFWRISLRPFLIELAAVRAEPEQGDPGYSEMK